MRNICIILVLIILTSQGLISDELIITNPKGGEVLSPWKPIIIQWEGSEIQEGYKVEFSSDMGENWVVLQSNITGYEYKWLVPNMELNKCLIRVSQKSYDYIDIEWMKSFGGSSSESLTRVLQTKDGNYLLAGQTNSTDGDIISNNGESDIWLLKLDTFGEVVWSKTYGGSKAEGLTDIKENEDGIFHITGYSLSIDGDAVGNNIETMDAWILKLDSDGEIIYSKFYGASSADYPYSIVSTNDGGSAFAGMTYSSDIQGSNSLVGLWVTKLDSVGNELWSRKYGGSLIEAAYSMKSTSDNGFIITGISLSNDGLMKGNYGAYDILTLKLDSDGKVEWVSNNGSWQDDSGYDVNETKDLGFIVTGYAGANGIDVTKGRGWKEGLTIKFDKDGNKEWSNTYSTVDADYLYGVNQLENGSYLTSGYTYSVSKQDTNIKYYKSFINKIDENGEHEWVKSIDDKLQTTINSQFITTDGEYIFGGNMINYSSDSTLLDDNSIILIKAKPSFKAASTAITKSPFSVSAPTSIEKQQKQINSFFRVKHDSYENKLYIELLEEELLNSKLEIYNNEGRFIESIYVGAKSLAHDISIYSNGRYYISLYTPTESVTEIFEVVR